MPLGWPCRHCANNKKADRSPGRLFVVRDLCPQVRAKAYLAANGWGVLPFLATTSRAVGEPEMARLIDSLTAW